MAVSFRDDGIPEYREGLVVRFYPRRSDAWVGNFLGGPTGCNAVLEHPNGNDVIVVARGEASVVDPENRAIRHRLAAGVEQVIELPSLEAILLRGLTDFTAIKADDTGWHSPRISWDGMRKIKVNGTQLFGEAYTPIGDAWVPFTLDLLTGGCLDGVYAKDMGRAVRIVARGSADDT